MFSINFLDNIENNTIIGEVKIDEYIEEIEIDLSYWNKNDYKTQWRDAIDNLKKGEEKWALVTSMSDLKTANFITIWPMYRINETIYIQNQVLFLDDIKDDFSIKKINKFLDERDSDEEVSEWKTTLGELTKWGETLEKP